MHQCNSNRERTVLRSYLFLGYVWEMMLLLNNKFTVIIIIFIDRYNFIVIANSLCSMCVNSFFFFTSQAKTATYDLTLFNANCQDKLTSHAQTSLRVRTNEKIKRGIGE